MGSPGNLVDTDIESTSSSDEHSTEDVESVVSKELQKDMKRKLMGQKSARVRI